MWILKCDRCGMISEPQKNSSCPKGWQELSYQVSRFYNTNQLCPKCCIVLKIPACIEPKREQTISDNLIDILSEIAQDAVKN